jgi:hypothetical protein
LSKNEPQKSLKGEVNQQRKDIRPKLTKKLGIEELNKQQSIKLDDDYSRKCNLKSGNGLLLFSYADLLKLKGELFELKKNRVKSILFRENKII